MSKEVNHQMSFRRKRLPLLVVVLVAVLAGVPRDWPLCHSSRFRSVANLLGHLCRRAYNARNQNTKTNNQYLALISYLVAGWMPGMGLTGNIQLPVTRQP